MFVQWEKIYCVLFARAMFLKKNLIYSKYSGIDSRVDGYKIAEELSKARHEYVHKMKALKEG